MKRPVEFLVKAFANAVGDLFYMQVALLVILTFLLMLVFWVTWSLGGGLWFGLASLAGAHGVNIYVNLIKWGGFNPMRMWIWWLRPYGRLLYNQEFNKKVKQYMKRVYLESVPVSFRAISVLPPVVMILLSLKNISLNLEFLLWAEAVGGGVIFYFFYALMVVRIQKLYEAKNTNRISKFFGVPQLQLRKIKLVEIPRKIRRPSSVTYISVPFIVVGILGLTGSAYAIVKGLMGTSVIANNPEGTIVFGLIYALIGLSIFTIGRWLLQMRKEGAVLVGTATIGFLFISLLVLVGNLLRSFLSPSAPPFLTPLWTILFLLGLCISILTLWVLKKHWGKFSRGLGQFATLGETSEEE